ncbi:putative lipid II flippase FtsW [Thermomicrobium sp. 4228-Ro]|uniref:putative lipid II flippase FtsW n=1 Tax=Thermomicrobium sp. 4228-Ro TaxID=2993937 RepID=UPI0022491E60|nr:putative lipid II flippase FtsW [Thermomicrobium sp. 4228-Ro]MCX2727293.1 putative lipid II flippase FtsW [Thermomicrobium sp. 4228-Ro]
MRSLARRITQLLALPAPPRTLHEPDLALLLTLLALAAFGLVMVFSASVGSDTSYAIRHAIWLTLGAVAAVVTTALDYRVWRRLAVPALLAAVALLLVVLVPGIGDTRLGAQRWIDLGPLSFQPSEVAKLALVLYLASWLASKGDGIRRFGHGVVPFVVLLGALVGLTILQPDLGTSMILVFVGFAMFFAAGAAVSHFALLGASGMAAALVLALGASYRRERLLVFLSSDQELFDPNGLFRTLGWQIAQARLAFGGGGWFGVGLGAGRQKFQWLPHAHNDAIFAVIGEELGVIGCSVVLLLFLLFAWRGLSVARRAPDRFGALLAVGITSWIVGQALVNVGGITSTLPFTGIPLPFVSYGGSALVSSLLATGILLSVSRATLPRGAEQPVERPARVPVGRHPSLTPALRSFGRERRRRSTPRGGRLPR